jgi:hypothetical protein
MKLLRYLRDVLIITLVMLSFIGGAQSILITQDNQNQLNDISIRLNALEAKAPKIQVRHSYIYHIEQWFGDHRK